MCADIKHRVAGLCFAVGVFLVFAMAALAAAAAAGFVKEVLPPPLDSSSEPPALFDGTSRLYIAYICPFAQRTWITRNVKGLQEKIKLVPIDLQNRPAWYKEKVYSANKVPSLEYKNEVKGESLDLLKYIDETFEGPALLPDASDFLMLSLRGCHVCLHLILEAIGS